MKRLCKHSFGLLAVAFPHTASWVAATAIQSPDDPSPGDLKQEGYQPPMQLKSVPGAPVRVWGTPYGIIVETEDLDAGDDIQLLIDQQLSEESDIARPTIYQLKHVEAAYMKSLVENMYGLEPSSGGGGSGLLGGIADNVIGEAGGGVVDSLFGGGLGGGSTVSAFEGDVSLSIDGRLNYLIVMGATNSDLELIDAARDLFDIPTSPQNPEIGGQIYKIQIRHRDPEEVKALVDSIMEMYFTDAEENRGGNGGGGNDAANVARLLQAVGGRGGGGGGKSAEEVKARGHLGVDIKTRQLIFMGPKSIFRQIEAVVAAIDLPEVEVKQVITRLDIGRLEPRDVIRKLKEMLGSTKIDDSTGSEAEEENADSGSPGQANRRGAGGAEQQRASADAAARSAAFQQLFRARQQQGGGGGGRGRGQGGGAGGGRRGGGR